MATMSMCAFAYLAGAFIVTGIITWLYDSSEPGTARLGMRHFNVLLWWPLVSVVLMLMFVVHFVTTQTKNSEHCS